MKINAGVSALDISHSREYRYAGMNRDLTSITALSNDLPVRKRSNIGSICHAPRFPIISQTNPFIAKARSRFLLRGDNFTKGKNLNDSNDVWTSSCARRFKTGSFYRESALRRSILSTAREKSNPPVISWAEIARVN